MPSAGSQDPTWQRWKPRGIVLAQVATGGSGAVVSTNFQVPTPDSRLRVKISLIFHQNTPGVQPNAQLWLHASDVDDTQNQGLIPVNNLAGSTQAAPITIPADNGLQGFSIELVSSADYIEGAFNVLPNGAVGYWVLQTRYQPDAVRFQFDEWDKIISQCNPTGIQIKAS